MRHLAVIFAFLASPNMFAQERLAFEVASIKPVNPKGGGMIGYYTDPGGKLTIGTSTLAMLVEFAFDVQTFQVSGGPSWAREDRYDIAAKPPFSATYIPSSSPKNPLNKQQREMLQTLLADRFQLKVHRETKLGPVYILSKGSERPGLQPAKDTSVFSWVGSPHNGMVNGDGLAGINISMPLLATRLSRYLGRPVLDQTGLNGAFDFKVDYAPDENPDVVGSIITCIQKIGLKLKSAKGPMETIVIDNAQRPSEN